MRRRSEHWWSVGRALLAIPLLASTASAEAPAAQPAPHTRGAATPSVKPPNAKALVASAQAKRAAGDFEGALADYQAADAVAASPVTIEGIAFCHDKLGQFDDALTWYAGFLASVPPSLQAEADAAKARVDTIKAMPGHLHLESSPSNAVVSIDGKEQPTHTPIDTDLLPGKHTLHVVAEGHEAVDKDVEVASRSKQNLVLELPVTPPPPPPPVVAVAPPPPPPPPPRSALPAYITGGLAIVAAGVGTGFGIAAISDKSNFNKNPTTATANSGENNALVSDMGFGIAITLGVTSVVLFTTRQEPAASAPAATPVAPAKTSALSSFTAAPFVTAHGGGAGALLSF